KTSFSAAMEKAFEWEKTDKIPIGVLYQKDAPIYEDEIYAIKNTPLYEHDISNVGIQKLLDEFA
ncbi:2-oxoacid ferredoxin oxidoreductase, partial [Candidatus Micrarchaeota archaeon]|nr:2-oxoacid ferredoxin oxidoreductase [Candidatus Micrarchaeota archaeon]